MAKQGMQESLLSGPRGGSDEKRELQLHDYDTNAKQFANNTVGTSKYSAIPLSPRFCVWKNLFEQFHRYANVYFLVVAILQLIPGLSPTGRFTTVIPLSMVLFVTFCKDTYEDYKRHVRDKEVNGQPVRVFRKGAWTNLLWRDVVVGDIVEVNRDVAHGEFPADLLLLWSTEAGGLCHIETSNLDGETNLKLRKTHAEPSSPLPPFNPEDPGSFTGTIQCQPPNPDLYKFEGRLVRRMGGQEVTSAIDVSSILLRGAKLGGSTRRIMGAVVYCGKQSKLMMNQQESRHKASRLEGATNKQIIFIFIVQVTLCTVCACGLGLLTTSFSDHWYLSIEGLTPAFEALKGVGTFIILFNNLIPISLYVSMEMVKIVQAQLMNMDILMYHEESDTPADAKTSSLNEELGQVQYIFSDKTGTLTCNIMDFLKFSVGMRSYGTGTTEIGRAAAVREGKVLADDRPPGVKLVQGFYFYDDRISDVTGEGREWRWMREPNANEIAHFLKVLAVCHTVVTEETRTESGALEILYQAASPDEVCLVKGAKCLGMEFVSRDVNDVTIKCATGDGSWRFEKWQLFDILEFNSDRKRMSIICKDPSGKLLLLCKGADTVIFERLRQTGENKELHDCTLRYLNQFAADGLRTLCIAQAELDKDFYEKWAVQYKAATESVGDREAKVAAAAAEIETNLELIGTTAIEDKLQEGVPSTIELLRAAGINVWVLTGDKQETAINIGYACALLHNNMGLFMFDEESEGVDEIGRCIERYAKDAEKVQAQFKRDLGVVVQGSTLSSITAPEAPQRNKDNFLKLTKHCKAVVCCRVTPAQKAEVVRLVKDGLNKVTLSIGDGANDVSMITEAHVGIGISGLEGLQAARASDYAIGQFRFLQRLLLVHGRWSYRRVAKVILYSFYKNILLYLTQFWFCFFNSFTGQSLYDRWALAGFNVAFTAFPIMAVGILDRDIDPNRILSMDQFPELYDDGRESRLFSTAVFWQFTFTAIWQSGVCFAVSVMCLMEAIEDESGREIGMHWLGITAYSSVVWVVTLKCALETTSWTWVNHVATWGSLGMWYVFLLVYGHMWEFGIGPEWYKMYMVVLVDSKHWLTVVLCITIAMYRDVTWKFYQRTFMPKLVHKIQAWEKLVQNSTIKTFNYRIMKRVHPELLPRIRQQTMAKKRPAPSTTANPLTTAQPGAARSLPQAPSMGQTGYTGYAFSQSEGNQIEVMANRPETTGARWAHENNYTRRAILSQPGQMAIDQVVERSRSPNPVSQSSAYTMGLSPGVPPSAPQSASHNPDDGMSWYKPATHLPQ
eukprot:Sspe_Gene.45043::Locus_22187_Transcript_1_1_Confidence_1.000_Length_4308::g.45043::m.45043/K14802/DRS2, ATP8A; phospholipid-transporting ATPase